MRSENVISVYINDSESDNLQNVSDVSKFDRQITKRVDYQGM